MQLRSSCVYDELMKKLLKEEYISPKSYILEETNFVTNSFVSKVNSALRYIWK